MTKTFTLVMVFPACVVVRAFICDSQEASEVAEHIREELGHKDESWSMRAGNLHVRSGGPLIFSVHGELRGLTPGDGWMDGGT